jgi:restriction endonuclease Mrr
VINEDVLGLDIIYLQAKRYATGNAHGFRVYRNVEMKKLDTDYFDDLGL